MNADDAPLESLLEHADWVRRLAESLLLDQDQVDDVVQQTWLAAIERTPRRVATPRGWLAGVVRNVALQMSRTEKRRRSAIPQVSLDAVCVESRANDHLDVHRRLLSAVEALDEADRSLVVMRYFEGRTPREMAADLGLPVTTIRNRLSRALGRLRSRLDRDSGGRRAWSLALVGFLTGIDGGSAQAATASAAASTAGNPATSTGGLRALVQHPALAVVLVLAAVISVASWITREDTDDDLRDVAARAADEVREVGRVERHAVAEPTSSVHSKDGDVAITPAVKPRGGHVSGRILDTDGIPVEGARIRVVDDSDGASVAFDEMSKFDRRGDRAASWTTKSDRDGRFRVDVAESGTYRVIATAEGYSHAVRSVGELADGDELRVAFRVHAVPRIRCVVRDEAGRPIEGVSVDVHSPEGWVADHSRLIRERRVTDADGEFSFGLQQNQVTDVRELVWDAIAGGLVASRQSITLAKRGRVTRTIDRFGGLSTDEHGRIIIPMARGRDVTFTFRPTTGERLGGPIQFLAKLDTSRILRRGVTDEDGRVTIEDLPEVRVARFVVESDEWVVDHPDGAWIGTAPSQAGLPVMIPRTGDGHAVVPLGRGATLRGRAVDAVGRAVAGVTLLVSPHGGNLGAASHLRSVTTASDGTFSVSGIVPGKNGIFCADDSWVITTDEDTRRVLESGHRTGRLMEVRIGRTYDVVLEMARSAVVTGRVLDSQGEPVDGAVIGLADNSAAFAGWPPRLHRLLQGPEATCDAGGRFRLGGLAPGLDVELLFRDVRLRPTKTDPFTLCDGDVHDLGDLAAHDGAEIRIVVRDAQGRGLRGLDVMVAVGREYRFYERRGDARLKTDEFGRAVVRSIPPGEARIALGDVRHFGLVVPPEFSGDVIVPESGVVDVEIDLVRPLLVEGRAVDEEGVPLSGMNVHVEPVQYDDDDVRRLHAITEKKLRFEGEGLRRGARFVASRRATTSANGTFRVTVDREREYRIIFFENVDGETRVRPVVGNDRARAGGGPVELVVGARETPRELEKARSQE